MKGYSLHIGVNKVNEDHYGETMRLDCASKDTESLSTFIQNTGLFQETNIIEGEDANSENIFKALDGFAALAEDNPGEEFNFLITATCHGFSLNTVYGGTDGRLELLCLYDRMVLEFEVQERLSKFKSNAKVFFVVSSCFAGGILMENDGYESYKQHLVLAKNPGKYEHLVEAYAAKQNEPYSYTCSLFFMGAVEKNILAVMGRSNEESPFIKAFLAVVRNPFFQGNYEALGEEIKMNSHRDRKPVFFHKGTDPNYFSNKRPIYFTEEITTLESKLVLWKVKFWYDPAHNNELVAEIDYPNTHRYVYMSKTSDQYDSNLMGCLLNNFYEATSPSDFSDSIRILIFQYTGNPTPGTTKVTVRLGVYKTTDLAKKRVAHVVLVDDTNKKGKKYEKSSKEVNDVIGGAGTLSNT
jgi:hypothetical protein